MAQRIAFSETCKALWTNVDEPCPKHASCRGQFSCNEHALSRPFPCIKGSENVFHYNTVSPSRNKASKSGKHDSLTTDSGPVGVITGLGVHNKSQPFQRHRSFREGESFETRFQLVCRRHPKFRTSLSMSHRCGVWGGEGVMFSSPSTTPTLVSQTIFH